MGEPLDVISVHEENDLLSAEVIRLREELEEDDRRGQAAQGGWLKRFFARLFGPKVYDGPHNCAHCRYWKYPRGGLQDYHWNGGVRVWYDKNGDCVLLFGQKNKTKNDDCNRFTPRRRYFRRVKTWTKNV